MAKVLKAPPNYDWDGLTAALLQAADLSLPAENEIKLSAVSRGEASVTAKVSPQVIGEIAGGGEPCATNHRPTRAQVCRLS